MTSAQVISLVTNVLLGIGIYQTLKFFVDLVKMAIYKGYTKRLEKLHRFNLENYSYIGQEVLINGVTYKVRNFSDRTVVLKNLETERYVTITTSNSEMFISSRTDL